MDTPHCVFKKILKHVSSIFVLESSFSKLASTQLLALAIGMEFLPAYQTV